MSESHGPGCTLEARRHRSDLLASDVVTGRHARRLVPLVLALSGSACTAEAPPRWIPVTVALEPRTARVAFPWRGGRELELAEDEHGTNLVIALEERDWQPVPGSEAWQLPLGLNLPPRALSGELRLETDAGVIPRALLRGGILKESGPAGFVLMKGSVFLRTGGGAPGRATLTCALDPLQGAGARVAGRGFTCEGVQVLPGERGVARIDLPPDSSLRFGTVAEPIVGALEAREIVFRVRLEGRTLHEHRALLAEEGPVFAWHSVPLPAEGRAAATLAFEVEGALGRTAFLAPVVGPRSDERGERTDPRPDFIVFLADTFRADSLTAYGGRHRLTPRLDELAESGLCFTHAWSTASWTLPAHASLFSGYYPGQVGVGTAESRLPEEVATVAEMLAAAGYRTAAFTGGGFVSAKFGLDQGFAVFSEHARELDEMLAEARAFLAAADGQPVFLFLHTFRAHWPYRVSARARHELGERLALRGEVLPLLDEALAEVRQQGLPGERLQDLRGFARSERMLALARELHDHYLGGVADLDHAVGGFLDHLRANGFLDTGHLVFTSDHGEAFAEHGMLFHAGQPFDEQARIPLLIAGRGLARATRADPVSLVDLAPTLLALADLPAPAGWPGKSLLAPPASRPLFGFEASGRPDDALFVLEERRKVLLVPRGTAEPTLIGAFDLAQDPEELDGGDADWANALLRKHGEALAHSRASPLRGETAVLDADAQAELQALGY